MRLARTPYPIRIYHIGFLKARERREVFIEKKKMGRPTDNPRNKRLSLRIAESEMKDIDFCAKKLSITKIEAVLKGISLLKNEINTK